jgi:hypothetical protein
MFAQIVRFTRAPQEVPVEERERWIGVTIPITEFCDLPHQPCFTTAGALYQALRLAGLDEAARRHGSSSACEKILVEGDDLEVVDARPVFWVNLEGSSTLHRLPKITPGTRRLNCGKIAELPEIIALSEDWYLGYLATGRYPVVLATNEVALALKVMGQVHLCGNCLRVAQAHPHHVAA